MRIKSLKVKDFYILKDFKIDFNSNLSVLIGENGSGKSTILELIADIFGHLYKYFVLGKNKSTFIDNYEIEYEYTSYDLNTIKILSGRKDNKFLPTIWINGEDISIAQIENKFGGMSNFLPSKIILNYAGISEHLRTLSEYFEEKYKKEITKANNQYSLSPLHLPKERPFIYIKSEHLPMLVLSLFFSDNKQDKDFLTEYLKIDKGSCQIALVFKRPSWAKKKDEKWWGISGNVALQFFQAIELYADKEEKTNDNDLITYYFDGTTNLETAFAFELNAYRKDLVFTIFDTLLYDELLSEIKITWNTDNRDGMSLDRLSEGQKQIIQTLSVNYVLGEDKNLLYLYDEPDVFLHPQWQQEFVSKFNYYNESSHIIITTHNPILIGDLQKEQVYKIHNGKIVESNNYSFGRDVNSILGDYFNVNERSRQGKELINNFYDSMDAKNYDKAEEYLKELKENFGPEDVSTVRAESLFDDLAE